MGNTSAKPRDEEAGVVTVDEGQVGPLGLYPNAPQDWDIATVQRLIYTRRLAPFYSGLPEADDAAEHTTGNAGSKSAAATSTDSHAVASIEIPAGRDSTASSGSPRSSFSSKQRFSHDRQRSTSSLSVSSSHKGKRSASLPYTLETAASSSCIRLDLLYKNPIECPICFLYYPRNINYSRCCEQPICTECFVQIKRPEATLDPAACPFCVENNFGIIYYPPNSAEFKTRYGDVGIGGGDTRSDAISIRSAGSNAGLSDLSVSPSPGGESFMQTGEPVGPGSGDGELHMEPSKPLTGRRKSLNHSFPGVVTTDEIRPDGIRKQQQVALARIANERRGTLFGAPGTSRRGPRGSSLVHLGDGDMEGAAAAAAAVVEALSGGSQSGREAQRRRTGRGGANRTSVELPFSYLEAMRNMGADLEELMIMEAMRRSLLESSENATTGEAAAAASNTATEGGSADATHGAATDVHGGDSSSSAAGDGGAASSSSSAGVPTLTVTPEGSVSGH